MRGDRNVSSNRGGVGFPDLKHGREEEEEEEEEEECFDKYRILR